MTWSYRANHFSQVGPHLCIEAFFTTRRPSRLFMRINRRVADGGNAINQSYAAEWTLSQWYFYATLHEEAYVDNALFIYLYLLVISMLLFLSFSVPLTFEFSCYAPILLFYAIQYSALLLRIEEAPISNFIPKILFHFFYYTIHEMKMHS